MKNWILLHIDPVFIIAWSDLSLQSHFQNLFFLLLHVWRFMRSLIVVPIRQIIAIFVFDSIQSTLSLDTAK